MSDTKPTTTRRTLLLAGLGIAGAAAGNFWWRSRKSTPADVDTTAGLELLRSIPAIDVHSHPGRSFLANSEFSDPAIQSMGYGFEAERIADMQAGNVTASLFAIVADVQVLGVSAVGGIVATREFEPGEAYADFSRQLDYFRSLVDTGVLSFAHSRDDIMAAHADGRSVAVLASEGAGFVEDKLERLQEAHAAGVRSIGVVHYRPNEYGDIQTQAPQHDGLTSLGADLVREMNRLGLLIDTAHATFATVRDIVEISSVPVMLSHSHLVADGVENPRLISAEHADLIAQNGGVIGSWPAGITNRTMSDFVDETFRLIDQVGIDHVAVGTDLDANYRPVLTDYAQFPAFASMLLERGLSAEEAGKVLGLNFLRVFDAATTV